jgi:hypothetical protein
MEYYEIYVSGFETCVSGLATYVSGFATYVSKPAIENPQRERFFFD